MKWPIAHITDIHLNEPFPAEQGVDQKGNWELILEDLRRRKIRSVIFGGDIGARSALKYFYQSLEGFDLYISPGNHDIDRELGPHLEPPQGKDGHYLYYDDETYRYILMDSSKELVSEAQKQWLASALDCPLEILLAIHHPILPVPCYIDNRHYLQGRNDIQAILQQAGKTVTVLCGHYHLEDERKEGNIRQLLTLAASYVLGKSEELIIKTDHFGYRLMEKSPQGIASTVIHLKSN